jgi:ABC-type bacteriocin/lantibiotic exporter with double-glycine peptidase domain
MGIFDDFIPPRLRDIGEGAREVLEVLGSAAKRVEELTSRDAVVLDGMPRCVQVNDWSCGVECVRAVLTYYDVPLSFQKIVRIAGATDEEGTPAGGIRKVLRRQGLTVHTFNKGRLRDLREAIDDGCPIIATVHDGGHYVVVYGYDSENLFVMNPSVNVTAMGRIGVRVDKRAFRNEWDGWGIVVWDDSEDDDDEDD